jgi:mannose/fructose/N-acetylgalactosamine-specific phosphotransferase system component IID
MARSRSKSPKRGGATSPAARRRKTPQAADAQVVDTAMLEGIKCAVIGACGFLGSAIVKRLTRTGVHAVVAIDVVDPVDPVCDDDDHRVSYVTPPMDTTTPSLSPLCLFAVLPWLLFRRLSPFLSSCQTVPLVRTRAESSHPMHTT